MKMELQVSSVEPMPETIARVNDKNSFYCGLFDLEIVHKIAEVLFPGLASACVDSTTGDPFWSPDSVAAAMRKEMIGFLAQRSETFVAESVILETSDVDEASEHPYDIISDFVDDFANLKRNIFSRFSGWLLSERREDKIDDFVQEMDTGRFWMIDEREAVVQNLLKNVDIRNSFHCKMKFNFPEEVAEHSLYCNFRSINCTNEGCNARVSACHLEDHDSVCPFKLLSCEQKCSDMIMRCKMDKHCITVCPMRLVICPFYPVGCQFSIPHSKVQEHVSENLHSHLLGVLRLIHVETSLDDLEHSCEKIEMASAPGKLAASQDLQSLISAVKCVETKLVALEVNATSNLTEEKIEYLNNVAIVLDESQR